MKNKIYNYVFDLSFFFMILSLYCKIAVSKFNILSKSDEEIVILFVLGILISYIMLFLLHCLFQTHQKEY